MKKSLCAMIAILVLAGTALSADVPYIGPAVALNATTYTPVTHVEQGISVAIQCRTSVDCYIATSFSPDSGAYWTLKAGTVLVIDIKNAGGVTLYAKAATGTPDLEYIYLRRY